MTADPSLAHYRAFGLKIGAPAGLALNPASPEDAETTPDLVFRESEAIVETIERRERRLLHDVEDFPGGPRLRVWAEAERYCVEYNRWKIRFRAGADEVRIFTIDAKKTRERSQYDRFHFSLAMERVFLPLYLLLSRPEQIGLHGSAVEFKGEAYLFIGRSGAGKSTTAYEFTRRGGRLLADDLIMVDPVEGVAFGGVPTLRLWREAGEVPEAIDERGIWQYEGSKRWFRMPQSSGAPDQAKIGALILLDPDAPEGSETIGGRMLKQGGRAALVELLSQTFDLTRPERAWMIGRFKNASKLVREYPCYRFQYKKSADGSPAHVDALFAAVRSLKA